MLDDPRDAASRARACASVHAIFQRSLPIHSDSLTVSLEARREREELSQLAVPAAVVVQ